MESKNGPDSHNDPSLTEPPLEDRPGVPGRDAPDPASPGFVPLRPADSEGTPRSHRQDRPRADDAVQRSTLSAGLSAFRDQLRDAERDLVDRIADVDDDRRRSVAQFQRALQTQRDEIDEGLRRQGRVTLLGLLLLAVLTGAALYVIYRHVETGQTAMAEQMTSLRQDMSRLTGAGRQDDAVQQRLAELAGTVERISASLGQLIQERDRPAAVPVPAPAPLDSEVERLRDQQRLLSAELTSLREALEAAETADSQAEETASSPQSSPSANENLGPTEPPDQDTAEPPPEPPAQPQDEAPPAGIEPVVEPGDTGATSPTVSPATAPPTTGARRLLVGARPVAIQLIGFFSLAELEQFARRADLPPEIYYREESYRGRPWFVLIHSLYDTTASAEAALARLPPELTRLDTWIRTLEAGSELIPLASGSER